MTNAYSYVRFSSGKQAKGTSLDRQLEMAREYAATHHLTLSTETYRDLGISAFQSKNRTEGALGAFLAAVERGTIKPGSYLLVEAFDRISRDKAYRAMGIMTSIIEAGINLVTLKNGTVFSKATIEANQYLLFEALFAMVLANDESTQKSMRVRQAFERKKAAGKVAHTKVPSWLKVNDDQTGYVIRRERAVVVKRIFDLTINGHSQRHIANLLNDEGVKAFQWGERLTKPTIQNVLNNPAVYGFRPGNLGGDNHYPAIIDKRTYDKAQAATKSRRWKTAPSSGGLRNLLAGMIHCAKCDGYARLRPARPYAYYQCNNYADFHSCTGQTVPVPAVEQAIVTYFSALVNALKEKPAPVVDKDLEDSLASIASRKTKLVKLASIAGDIDEIGTELQELETKRIALVKQLRHSQPAIVIDELNQNVLFSHAVKDTLTNLDKRRAFKATLQMVIKRLAFGFAKGYPALTVTLLNDASEVIELFQFLPERAQKLMHAKVTGDGVRARRRTKKVA